MKPEWAEAGRRAAHMQNTQSNRDKVAAIIEEIEPMIRADEFEAAYRDVINRCRKDGNTQMALADLRAKVEALPDALTGDTPATVLDSEDVLALIDGEMKP